MVVHCRSCRESIQLSEVSIGQNKHAEIRKLGTHKQTRWNRHCVHVLQGSKNSGPTRCERVQSHACTSHTTGCPLRLIILIRKLHLGSLGRTNILPLITQWSTCIYSSLFFHGKKNIRNYKSNFISHALEHQSGGKCEISSSGLCKQHSWGRALWLLFSQTALRSATKHSKIWRREWGTWLPWVSWFTPDSLVIMAVTSTS